MKVPLLSICSLDNGLSVPIPTFPLSVYSVGVDPVPLIYSCSPDIVPATSSFVDGAVVPMPTLPFSAVVVTLSLPRTTLLLPIPIAL